MDEPSTGSYAAQIEPVLPVLQGVHLSPSLESRLALLAQTAEALGLDEPSTIGFNQSITNLSSRRLDLKISLNRAKYVEEELRIHLTRLQVEIALLQGWSTSLSERASGSELKTESETGTAETTETLERRRQLIIRKAKEYQAQLSHLNSTNTSNPSTDITISDLTRLQAQNKAREKEIRKKRKKVEAFRRLPANPELARLSLLQITQKLQELTRVREGLLSKMIDD